MSFTIRFDATRVKPNTGAFSILEDGDYDVKIVATEEKPSKATPGNTFIEVKMEVLTGTNKGDTVFDRLNIRHSNQAVVDIAFGTLSAICHVTGRLQINSTAELHGIPFKIRVKKVPRNDKPDSFSNEVKSYMDQQGRAPGEGQQFAPQEQQQFQQAPAQQAQPQFQQQAQQAPVQQFQQSPAQQFVPQEQAPVQHAQQAQQFQQAQPQTEGAAPSWAVSG